MGRIPTVKIENPWGGDGYVVINEDDFDGSRHKRWVEPNDGEEAPDPEAVAAVDLRETPIRALADALAGIDDATVVRAALEADDRASARKFYEARLAELEG